MVFLFEITVAMHRWLWNRELDIWCELWGLVCFLFCTEYCCRLLGCCLLIQKCWSTPGCCAGRRVWLFALGHLMAQSVESHAGEHPLLRAVAALERCPKVLCVLWAGPRKSYFALFEIFPRDRSVPWPKIKLDLHDLRLKYRRNFSQSALCSFLLLLYAISYTTAKNQN